MPHSIRRDYLACRLGQVHIRRAGENASRPPLLCFHQVPNSGQVFESVLPVLAEGRQVIAFDTPGFGMSDPVTGPETITAYAAALGDAIRALGLADQDVDLLGYHTGVAIAVELTVSEAVRTRRLALAAVPLFDPTERSGSGALPSIAFDEAGAWASEEWRRSWRWRGPGQSRESVLRTFAEKMRPGARERGATAIMSYDLSTALAQVRQPLLIMRPQDDLWEVTLRAAALCPRARWVDLPDLGHGMWDVAPSRLAALLKDFLD